MYILFVSTFKLGKWELRARRRELVTKKQSHLWRSFQFKENNNGRVRLKAKTPTSSQMYVTQIYIYIYIYNIPLGLEKTAWFMTRTTIKQQPTIQEWVLNFTHGSHAMVLIYPINGPHFRIFTA